MLTRPIKLNRLIEENKQNNNENEQKKYKPQMTEDDLSCPIGAEGFFDPVVTNCGHFFEEDNLRRWIEEDRSKDRDANPEDRGKCFCPTCKTEIIAVERDIDFNKSFQQFLMENKGFHDSRYFNAQYFFQNIIAFLNSKTDTVEDLETIKMKAKLINMLQLLKYSKKHLNTIPTGKDGKEIPGYNGLNPLTLISKYPNGMNYIIENNLHHNIEPEGLNTLGKTGVNKGLSAVFCFAANPDGRSLLCTDEKLRNKISSPALNACLTSGPFRGMNALGWLTQSEEGIALLRKDAKLCDKITSEGLNSINNPEVKSRAQEFRGFSPIAFLAGSVSGVELLWQNPSLCAKVTEVGFRNIIDPIGPDSSSCKGESTFSLLTRNENGRSLLLTNPHLCGFLTRAELTTIVEEICPNKDAFAHWLIMNPKGQAVLQNNPAIVEKLEIQKSVFESKKIMDELKSSHLGEHKNEKKLIPRSSTPANALRRQSNLLMPLIKIPDGEKKPVPKKKSATQKSSPSIQTKHKKSKTIKSSRMHSEVGQIPSTVSLNKHSRTCTLFDLPFLGGNNPPNNGHRRKR